jgi:hypothetical protein
MRRVASVAVMAITAYPNDAGNGWDVECMGECTADAGCGCGGTVGP